MASGGFAGAAAISGAGTERTAAGPLDDLADAAADRLETHEAVFGWVLELLAEKGLLKGKTVGIDATTCSMKSSGNGLAWKHLRRLNKAAQSHGRKNLPDPRRQVSPVGCASLLRSRFSEAPLRPGKGFPR